MHRDLTNGAASDAGELGQRNVRNLQPTPHRLTFSLLLGYSSNPAQSISGLIRVEGSGFKIDLELLLGVLLPLFQR